MTMPDSSIMLSSQCTTRKVLEVRLTLACNEDCLFCNYRGRNMSYMSRKPISKHS